jgi:hypothetical protein
MYKNRVMDARFATLLIIKSTLIDAAEISDVNPVKVTIKSPPVDEILEGVI